MSALQANPFLFASGDESSDERSLRINSDDDATLSKTFSSEGNRRTWTWSGWIKRSVLDAQQYLFHCYRTGENRRGMFIFESDNTLLFDTGGASSQYGRMQTQGVYRDPSAWYHVVLAFDSTQSIGSNRIKIYVNGTLQSLQSGTTVSQNYQAAINSNTYEHRIGSYNSTGRLDVMLAHLHFIDGQALAPTDFGETDDNGVWQPKEFAGTYGTNGFHLDFKDNSSASALGNDAAGSNNWTVNNLSVAAGSGNDSLVDSPSQIAEQSDTGAGGEVVGNYCTWNPLTPQWANVTYGSGWGTLSNGNLNITASGLSQAGRINGTFGMSAGKWYWESTITSTDGMAIGIAAYDSVPSPNGWTGTDSKSYAYSSSGVKNNNNSPSSYGASFTTNDVIGVAFDADNGTLTFYKNGSSQGTAFTGLTNGPYVPSEGYANRTTVANFGQRQYTHSAPSGYKSLNTANLPTPTIADGSQYFDTKLYSGNGGTQALTMDNSSMSPGFVWIKRRDGSAWHFLFDTVRGSNKALFSNDTAAESNYGSNYLDAFTSNGFTLGSNADVNGSSRTFAAWTWAGGTSTVTNNDGSIASQVRANPSAGFSIATFTGTGSSATIGHGLNAEPHLLLTKCRESGFNWAVYHKSLGNTGRLMLNNTLAFDTGSGAGMWNNTTPTNSVFSVGSFFASGNTFVAYCFSSVSGYSAMGSYVGNGNADGVFVYLGFRPKFIIFKISSGSEDWMIFDTARDTYNLTDQELYANLSKAEEDNDRGVDILSNGFKTRTTSSKFNGSGSTYIYIAFAENPFQANGGLAR